MQERPDMLTWQDAGAIEAIVHRLRAGAVAALPTETVYGLSCLAHSEVGVRRIAALKGIRGRRGFVALVGATAAIEPYLAFDQDRRSLEFLARTWPAPLTAILSTRELLPWGETQSRRHTAAFRVPAHSQLRQLLLAAGEPVLSTSINRTGLAPLVDPADILMEFGPELDLLVFDGASARAKTVPAPDAGRPSSVADFTVWPPTLLRAGGFDLDAALGGRGRSLRPGRSTR